MRGQHDALSGNRQVNLAQKRDTDATRRPGRRDIIKAQLIQGQPHPVAGRAVDADDATLNRAVIAKIQHGCSDKMAAPSGQPRPRHHQQHRQRRQPDPVRPQPVKPPKSRLSHDQHEHCHAKPADHGERGIKSGSRLIAQRKPATNAKGHPERHPRQQSSPHRNRTAPHGRHRATISPQRNRQASRGCANRLHIRNLSLARRLRICCAKIGTRPFRNN